MADLFRKNLSDHGPGPELIAIIVKRLELSILTIVIARFAYVVIVIRMTTRMVFIVQVIP